MKFLGVLLALCIGCSNLTYAMIDGSALEQKKPIEVRIISRDAKGVFRRENFHCTPKTCCFSESFYCFMENGRCLCDIHRCGPGTLKTDTKTYWLKLVGTEAERYCGRPRMLHDLTKLCLCDAYKTTPCDECNPPSTGCGTSPNVGASLPKDCSP